MISISTLYCGSPSPSHELRFGRRSDGRSAPVVVYNCTERCNLSCLHCYYDSTPSGRHEELSTRQAKAMLDDLAGLGVPVVLFSGGEPLLRDDLPELIAHAAAAGIRPVISTNGTLIGRRQADQLAAAGAAYVGISIDGLAGTHDRFRRADGAFAAAIAGLRHCHAAGIKVGLRMTLTRQNAAEIEAVFELARRYEVPRLCFYHLAYSGRGRDIQDRDLDHAHRRELINRIMDLTAAEHSAGRQVEVLTVDNHADGPFVYLRLAREDPRRAAVALELLRRGGGNPAGVRLACVRADGQVLPDQFWLDEPLGNVRRRPFSAIWTDPSNELLSALRQRPRPLKGRCARCRWLEICNGNLRARAQAATGELWGEDPACYLTDEEIAPNQDDPGAP